MKKKRNRNVAVSFAFCDFTYYNIIESLFDMPVRIIKFRVFKFAVLNIYLDKSFLLQKNEL